MTYSTIDVPVRGGRLHAGVWGDQGPLVVAAHGITSNHQSYALVGPDLGRDHRFVAVDLRGRGRSRDLPDPYGFTAHVADIAAVVKHLGEPAILVGHSMGGMIMSAASRLGAATRAVLIDGGPLLPPPPGLTPESDRDEVSAVVNTVVGPAFARLSRTFASPEEYLGFWRAHPAFADWNDAMKAYAEYDLIRAGDRQWRSACLLGAAQRDALDLYNFTGKPEEPLPVPAVFLHAERGMLDEPDKPFYPPGYADKWLPGIEVREVPGVNHYTITLGPAGARAVAAAVRDG
jgi:lipase